MNSTVKTVVFWLVIILAGVLLWQVLKQGTPGTKESDINFSQFLDEVNNSKVAAVTVSGAEIHGKYKDGAAFRTTVPPNYNDMYKDLRDKGVNITVKDMQGNSSWQWILNFAPLILLGALWFFMIRQMQTGGNKALSFGKSRARLLSMNQKKVTFKDVAGVDEAKEELREIIEFLREAQKFQKLGGRIPKGVLLVGPPGTGKTLLARAVAGEANVPFFSISGSDFVEMFVGVGASRVRDLFEQGKKNAPCIIFIDEIDAVGRHRGAGLGGGHDEREQTLNQLLVEMDGFESNEGVILVAATNRPDVLDPALLRPGRFDRRVVVSRPDVRGREEILRVHSRKIPLADDVDLSVLARGTPGFSGADLANMVNEAALNAARQNRKVVLMYDFEVSKDKVLMGAERKSMILTDEEKKVTAYHEAGHALVAAKLPFADPLHKVTIIPRGMALGVTMTLPEEDRHIMSRQHLEDSLCMRMGGRVAELLVYGDLSTGAADDLQRNTELARRMVREWGMSKEIGPMAWGSNNQVFLGEDLMHTRDYSDHTSKVIDDEIERILREQESRAIEVLTLHRRGLEALTRELLERETIDGAEAARLIDEANGEPVHPPGTKTVSALSGVGKSTPAKEATPVAPAATSPATPPVPATPNWQPPTLPAV